jgi:hypothetical protein
MAKKKAPFPFPPKKGAPADDEKKGKKGAPPKKGGKPFPFPPKKG